MVDGAKGDESPSTAATLKIDGLEKRRTSVCSLNSVDSDLTQVTQVLSSGSTRGRVSGRRLSSAPQTPVSPTGPPPGCLGQCWYGVTRKLQPLLGRDTSVGHRVSTIVSTETKHNRRERSRKANTLRLWEIRGASRRIEDFYEDPVTLGEGAFGSVTRWRLKRAAARLRADTNRSNRSSPTDHLSVGATSFGSLGSRMFDNCEDPLDVSRESHGYYAVKQIRWGHVWGDKESHEKQLEMIRQELSTIISLDHPNIAMIREWFEDPQDGIFFVMELCDGGSLQDALEEEVCPIESPQTRAAMYPRLKRLFKEVLYAVSYIHSQGVVHRDLKPENVMLRRRCTPHEGVKLIDFGLATLVEGEGHGDDWQQGTMLFMAPEMFLNSSGTYTKATDMWSLGVILAWLTSAVRFGELRHPLLPEGKGNGYEVGQYELFCAYREQHTVKQEHLQDMPQSYIDTILAMLTYEAEDRKSGAEILNMPWMDGSKSIDPDLLKTSGAIENILTWKELSEGDRGLLSILASNLTDELFGGLMAMFQELDTRKDGQLSKQEFIDGVKRCGQALTEPEAEHLFEEIDMNKSGGIQYHEWLCATMGVRLVTSETAIVKAFDALDHNNDGKIRTPHLEQVVGLEAAQELMTKHSRRPSRTLVFEEFQEAVHQMSEKRGLLHPEMLT